MFKSFIHYIDYPIYVLNLFSEKCILHDSTCDIITTSDIRTYDRRPEGEQ